jgi:hypothetical protein
MLDGVSVQVKPVVGEEEDTSVTVPVNPLTGPTVIVAVPCAPALTDTDVVDDWTVKFGTVTTTSTVIVWESEPLVPVTLTRNVPATAEFTVSIEMAVPPFTRGTLVGLSVPETPVGLDTDRVMVPAKLATLDKVIVETPFWLTATAIVEGDETTEKSLGGTVIMISTTCDREPLTPVTFTL